MGAAVMHRWGAAAFTLLAIGAGVYLLATKTIHIPGLFPEPPPSVEELAQEAEDAGNQAEEAKREELDEQSDAEVAAGSRVAEQHASDLDARHRAAVDAVRRAVDDLDRHLREDLHREAQRSVEIMSADEHADAIRSGDFLLDQVEAIKRRVDDFDSGLRAELRRRAAQAGT